MSPMLKALQAVKERGYNPPGRAPIEHLALISAAERRRLERWGGAGKMTKSGIRSYYDPDGAPGGTRDTGGSNTRAGNTQGSNQGSTRSSNTGGGSASRDRGQGGNAGSGGQGSTTQVRTGFGKMGQGSSQSGMGLDAPTVLGRMPQYTGPARYNSPFNANDKMRSFGGYPNSYDAMAHFGGNLVNQAPRAITDPYGGMGKMGFNSSQISPYNEFEQTAPQRYAARSAPQVVARLNPDGTLSLVKDQSRLAGMEPSLADQISYPSEEGQVYGPASLANYTQKPKMFMDRVKTQDRLPQEPTIVAQNYGFQAPGPTPADMAAQRRATIVSQWRENQIANTAAHRGLGFSPAGKTTMASVDPTSAPPEAGPSTWDNVRDIVSSGYDAFTDANKRINAIPGGAKTVLAFTRQPMRNLFPRGGEGGQDRKERKRRPIRMGSGEVPAFA